MSVIALARHNTIGDAFHRAARRHGKRTALRYDGRTWSYAELDRAVDKAAAFLLALGLVPGDRVAAYGRNSDIYLIAWLGCTRAGLVHVPVNYTLTEEELRYIIVQSGARAVLFDPGLAENIHGLHDMTALEYRVALLGDDAATLETAVLNDTDVTIPDPMLGPGVLAQLLYTSGTTAAPKGAMMTHAALLANYQSCICDLEFAESDRVLAALPLYHTAQLHCFAMPQLLMGATLILLQAPDIARCLDLIETQQITSFFAPPTVWISFLRHPGCGRADLSSLRKLYYGASIMPVPVLQEIAERLPQAGLYNCYGQSEIGPLATVLRPQDHAERPASAGRPVFNVETRVVDEAMNDVPPGTHGEIVHRSPQLLIGYWDKPDQTEEAFAGGWFHSGDLGYLDEAGYLYVVDRIKDVINTGGVLVASREVEEALLTCTAISEVAVVALPDPKWIEAVSAFVVLREGAQITSENLVAHAREHLAPYKVPKKVVFVPALPRNAAGKILKRQLRTEHGGSATPFDAGAPIG